MYRRELSNANEVKRMADFLGHSSTSEATKSITDNLITLSQVLTYNSFSLYISPARACEYTASLQRSKGRRCVIYTLRDK